MKKTALFIVLTAILAGCYYDNEENLYPKLASSCDTTQISLAANIRPILQAYCNYCHSTLQSAAFGGNIDLEDYNRLKQVAESGSLLGAVTRNPGFSPMPKGGAKLDACLIKKIKIWIDNGSPND